MRILSLSDHYPPFEVGGAEVIAKELNVALVRRGHDVTVLTTRPPGPGDYCGGPEKVYWVKHKASSNLILTILDNLYARPLKLALTLLSFLRDNHVDVVHATNGSSALAVCYAKLLSRRRIPSVLTFVSYAHVCPFGDALYSKDAIDCGRLSHIAECVGRRSKKRLPLVSYFFGLFLYVNGLLVRRCTSEFDNYTALSAHLEQVMLKRLSLDADRLEVVYPAMPRETGVVALASGPEKSEKAILYVGRFSTEKGVGVLLRAIPEVLERFPKTRFVFVGGSTLAQFADPATLEAIKSSVEVVGKVARREVWRYYDYADIVVIPSVWEEPFGFVALEAFSRSKPVVVSDVGGLAEVVGSAGSLVEPGKVSRLAGALIALLENPGLAREMAKKGHERGSKHFVLDESAKRMESVLSRAVKGSATGIEPSTGRDEL